MKTAKQLKEFYRTKIDEAHDVEEVRDLANLILDMAIAFKGLLEAKEIGENPIGYQECVGTGVETPWIICVDHLDSASERSEVGSCGGADMSQAQFDLLREGQSEDITLFRLYDDDGELYYSGRMVEGKGDGFAPLDDFGEPNAGCTRIDLYNLEKDQWETL